MSVKENYKLLIEQHTNILCAVEAHDVKRAQSAMRDHLKQTGDKMASILLRNNSS